ncbi:MAG: TadE family type IV pilus minor pilin [Microbacteriaceae bacterium]|nr:TadE family type IV pilus minor pilin [Microbacteriaceae bacterium]
MAQVRGRVRECGDERGALSAEFALILTAVMGVLALLLGALILGSHQVTLVSAAGEIARLSARGDNAAAEQRMSALPATTGKSEERRGNLLCVTLRAAPGIGPLQGIQLRGFGCAAVIESDE